MTFEIKEKNKRKGKPLSVCIWPEWPSSSHSRPKLPPLSLGSFRSNLGPAPRHPLSPSLWPKAGRPRYESNQAARAPSLSLYPADTLAPPGSTFLLLLPRVAEPGSPSNRPKPIPQTRDFLPCTRHRNPIKLQTLPTPSFSCPRAFAKP